MKLSIQPGEFGGVSLIDSEGKRVAAYVPRGPDRDRMALLIAHAPELYEVLKEAESEAAMSPELRERIRAALDAVTPLLAGDQGAPHAG